MFNDDYNCRYVAPRYGGRGVTFWGPVNTFSLSPNGGNKAWSFNCTHPKCYQDKDNCNVSFWIYIDANSTRDDVGPLVLYCNGYDMTPNYHSKIKGHDVKVTVDLAPNLHGESFSPYNDTGYNTLTFSNQDPQRTMKIALFQIRRVYAMCGLDKNSAGCCKDPPDPGCWDPNCGVAWTAGTNGNLDYTRSDKPCNYQCHGGYSYTGFSDNSFTGQISPGDSHTWTFSCGPRPTNYDGPVDCLFNFNQLNISNNATGNDVPFKVSINNHTDLTYYLSKIKGHQAFPGIDLTGFAAWYNDTGSNTVTLKNPSSNQVSLDVDDGGINIYRIYRTDPI